MNEAKYRVQLYVGAETLCRDFSEAITAVRSYRTLAKGLGHHVTADRDVCHVRLWNLELDSCLMSTEGIAAYARDPELHEALLNL